MNFARIKEYVELAAIVAILASLIFVGLQIRQEREIAATASVASAAEGRKQLAELISDNSEVWVKGLAGHPLSEYDIVVFRALADAQRLDYYASWYRASRLNHVPMERFPIQYAAELIENPGLLKFWREQEVKRRAIREQSVATLTSDWNSAVNEQLELLIQNTSTN
jgi:hypothetical protein